MKNHDKISFAREYCRIRRIPYRFNGESLIVKNKYVFFSAYNLDFKQIIDAIDRAVIYDNYGFFENLYNDI